MLSVVSLLILYIVSNKVIFLTRTIISWWLVVSRQNLQENVTILTGSFFSISAFSVKNFLLHFQLTSFREINHLYCLREDNILLRFIQCNMKNSFGFILFRRYTYYTDYMTYGIWYVTGPYCMMYKIWI